MGERKVDSKDEKLRCYVHVPNPHKEGKYYVLQIHTKNKKESREGRRVREVKKPN